MSDADCKHEPGIFTPVINRAKCEGKAACAAVCPCGVFTLGTVPADQRKGVGLLGRCLAGRLGRQRSSAGREENCSHVWLPQQSVGAAMTGDQRRKIAPKIEATGVA